jgi:hypothetical protein
MFNQQVLIKRKNRIEPGKESAYHSFPCLLELEISVIKVSLVHVVEHSGHSTLNILEMARIRCWVSNEVCLDYRERILKPARWLISPEQVAQMWIA